MSTNSYQNAVIWLDVDEYNVRLPTLFNSTRRRKKTIDSLFPHLGNQVYRCKEFPQGVYISSEGEVLPDDERSGIYHLLENADDNENGEETEDLAAYDPDDSEVDNYDSVPDEINTLWAQEELKHSKKSKRKRKRYEDDDDEYVFNPNEDYYEVDAGEDEEDEDEEDEEDEEDMAIFDDIGAKRYKQYEESKRERIRHQKLIRCLGDWEEAWGKLPLRRGIVYMKYYDPKFVCSTPSCNVCFQRPGCVSVTTVMDCENLGLNCTCGIRFSDMELLYNHLMDVHFT